MYLRKLRSLLSGLNCAANAKHYSTKNVTELIAKYLSVTEMHAKSLTAKINLKHVEYDELKEVLKIYDRLQADRKDILKYPGLLTRTPRIIEISISFLKEVGFTEVTLVHLGKFRACAHKKIRALKTLGYIPKHLNVPETLISFLHPKPIEFDPGEFTDDDLLSQVHSAIVKQYLMWRLEASRDEIETFFRVNYMIKLKSLRHICENIELAFKVGFAPRTLLKFGYVLSAYPDYPRTMLETSPNFVGSNLKAAMRLYPKLMTIPPSSFHKIFKMLKEADINETMIRNHMNIFTLSPNTVQLRLEELKNVPEMNVFRNNPKVLKIIVHHNRARSRLSFLQQLQLRCTSLKVLGKDDRFFEEKLREGKDVNVMGEIVNMLAHLLECDRSLIKKNLKWHPYHLQVSLVEMERSVKFLKRTYMNESIVNVLPIVLYTREKIEAALKEVKNIERLRFAKLSEMKKLNLALYYMEKAHHFTGNGVW